MFLGLVGLSVPGLVAKTELRMIGSEGEGRGGAGGGEVWAPLKAPINRSKNNGERFVFFGKQAVHVRERLLYDMSPITFQENNNSMGGLL